MTKILSIFNQKGGVGKTTFALCLSTYLASKNKKVLIIDNDSQANTTTILSGGELEQLQYNSNIFLTAQDLFLSKTKINKFILKSKFKNIDFIASSITHSQTDYKLASNNITLDFSLLGQAYDYIIIDNPPSLSITVKTFLKSSDMVISPIEPTMFSLDGLINIISALAEINMKRNSTIKFLTFLSKVDNRKWKKNNELIKNLIESIGDSFLSEFKLSLLSAYQNTIEEFETPITLKSNVIAYNEVKTLSDSIIRRL